MRAIGAPLTVDEADALVAGARQCIGARFRHRGRSPEIGFDCIGLLAYLMTSLGRSIQDRNSYGRDPRKDGLRIGLEINLGQPVTDNPRAADIVLMAFAGEPRHVGILADHPQGGLSLIHAYIKARKVVEHTYSVEWVNRTMARYRP